MTIYDLAKKLKVSPATVSMALSGDPKVAERTRLRVQAFAAKCGFTPSESARNFRLKKSSLVAVVVYRIDCDFWAGAVRAVEDALGESYSVIICNSYGDPERERRILQTLVHRKIAGLLIQPADPLKLKHLASLAKGGLPVVLFERTDEPELSFVKGDDYGSAREAVRLCAEGGHKRLAFLAFKTKVIGNRDRLEGFKDAAASFGLAKTCRVFELEAETEEAVEKAFGASVRGFSAAFCSDDRLVVPLMNLLRRKGVEVPKDMSILSWNNSPFLNYLSPPVSSMEIPVAEMGACAAKIAIACQDAKAPKAREFIPERLVLRESYKALK